MWPIPRFVSVALGMPEGVIWPVWRVGWGRFSVTFSDCPIIYILFLHALITFMQTLSCHPVISHSLYLIPISSPQLFTFPLSR